jgi:hypothetical protein
MPVHRYWRARNIYPVAGDGFELTEFQLLNGTSRADAGATIATNIAPVSGTLASLADDLASSVVAWAKAEGVQIDWDLGAAAEVNNFLLGAGADPQKFPATLTLLWSDDGVTYTIARRDDWYAYPGAFQKTRNVNPPVVVRSAGAMTSSATTSTMVCASPPIVEFGDLLIVAATTETVGATAPAGFVRQAAAGAAGPNNNRTEIWTRAVRTEADKDPGTWGGVFNIIALVVSGGVRQPEVEDFNTVATGVISGNAGSHSVPSVVAGGDRRLGISAAFWSLAFANPNSTDMAIAPRPPWVRHFTAIQQLRLGLATIPLSAGESTSGTWSSDALNASPIGGWSIIALVLRGADQIETRGNQTLTRLVQSPGRVLPLQPVPAYEDFGVKRGIEVSKLRRHFTEDVRGAGIGRVRGATKDKGTPNVPVSERTMLFRQVDGMPIRQTLSAPGTGAYSFDYIDETETYFVVAFDHDGTYRAVIADGLNLANGGVELIA